MSKSFHCNMVKNSLANSTKTVLFITFHCRNQKILFRIWIHNLARWLFLLLLLKLKWIPIFEQSGYKYYEPLHCSPVLLKTRWVHWKCSPLSRSWVITSSRKQQSPHTFVSLLCTESLTRLDYPDHSAPLLFCHPNVSYFNPGPH